MSDDAADDAAQVGGRPAVVRWRSGKLLDRRVCRAADTNSRGMRCMRYYAIAVSLSLL
jgi:hypothetical protein